MSKHIFIHLPVLSLYFWVLWNCLLSALWTGKQNAYFCKSQCICSLESITHANILQTLCIFYSFSTVCEMDRCHVETWGGVAAITEPHHLVTLKNNHLLSRKSVWLDSNSCFWSCWSAPIECTHTKQAPATGEDVHSDHLRSLCLCLGHCHGPYSSVRSLTEPCTSYCSSHCAFHRI